MNYKNISSLFVATAVVLGLTFGASALAASPQKVSYLGTPVTSAVPGKPFMLKFRVQNTSEDTYSGIKVIFHLPSEMTVNQVSPDNSAIDDNTVWWTDVPLEPGKSFYPSFNLTVDSGTSLKTKLNIWAQVTGGNGMPETSTNFSVTAVKTMTATPSSALSSADVSALIQSVYGRMGTASELKYWLTRRADKPGKTALWGAIAFAKANNIKH